MKKSIAIIVGGTGQFGVLLAEKLLKKKYKVIITTRSIIKAKKKFKEKKFHFKKLNILEKNQIRKLLLNNKPKIIFYTASQSSPGKSFKSKKETYLSNYIGCKNFLETIKKYFGYSDQRAKEVLNVLTDEDISYMETKLEKGGK